MNVHLGSLLAQRAALMPDHEALVDPGGRWTFSEFDARCGRLASYLLAHGVKEGDRVAICAKNGEFAATAVFAAARAGAIAVLLNWRLQVPELAYILSDCTPRAVLFEHSFTDSVSALRGQCDATLYLCSGASVEGSGHYEKIVRTPAAELPAARGPGGDAPAVIMYTSGTTGRPKGAVLSHRALHWTAQSNSCTLPWNQDHRFLLVAPTFHIGGLAPLITNVLKGSTTVMLPEFDPLKVWETIAKERITSAMTVPVMLQALLAVSRKMPVDASSLVYVSCGASAVPVDLIEAMRAMGVTVYQVYGTTEFCGAVSYWLPSMGLDKANSHGKATLFSEIRVVDPSGKPRTLTSGDSGEIWCRGPMAFSGYWNNPQASAEALQDGWYRTGDIGRIDVDGFLYVVDRLKDMIISGGENIYPAELEGVISRHPAVAEVAVVGRGDATWGEVPVAYVVRRPQATLDEAEVITLCREHLASYKCVRAVHFMDALPRSAVGKVLKPQLRG